MQFDYAAVGRALFAAGKRASVISARRRKIYDLVKRFEAAAAGRDPFDEVLLSDADDDAGQDGEDEVIT